METTAPILGPILAVVGLLMILGNVGVLLYSSWPRSKRQQVRCESSFRIPLRLRKSVQMALLPTVSMVVTLLVLVILGIALLVWLAPVPMEQMTPARSRLLDIAVGMILLSTGALLGFAGGRLAVSRGVSASN